ncbi:uncharacterized protein FIESC28_10407 [Fusarium coffeatum]|uniref:Rhodopsin domain-containing protein n=1 Tax=Fusarium coffeatum TaxID=231269 RepID=A0A366QVK1_9HYPO|nr:uncharacterized protein FIESC28_10407 [Fusarium coffeatum]RBR08025.1 hypothetical protein FIESC28_10407 [Fusarium coffeatum]
MVNGTEGLMAPSESHDVNFDDPQNTIIIYMNYCFLFFQFLVIFCILVQLVYGKSCERRFRICIILPACALTAAAGLLIAIEDATQNNTLVFAAVLLLILGTAVARLEISIAYCRVLQTSELAQNVIRLAGGLVVISSIAAWFGLLFACKTIDAAWNLRPSGEAQCIDRYRFHILQAVTGIVADVTVMVVMLTLCFPLQQSLKIKAVILAQLSSGILLPIPAVARLAILATRHEDTGTTFVPAPVILCYVIEANLVIAYSSVPSLKEFVREFANKWFRDAASMVNSAMGGRQGGMFRESISCLGGGGGSTNRTGSVAGDSARQGSQIELTGWTVGLRGP